MKRDVLVFFGGAASLLLVAGCSTKTTLFDPAATQTKVRAEKTVSSEEMRQVTADAVKSAMSNARFNAFLNQYKKEKNDPAAVPVLKLDRTVNDTDDPDLHTGEITDLLNEALLNAGKVDVTMAEGAGRSQEIAASRNLAADANFDQKTVAQRGTLQAARLIMRPKVISNTVRTNDKITVVRTFVVEMADVNTGLIIWKYSKQLGFMKEKGTFGW